MNNLEDYDNENPVFCAIHPELKDELRKLWELLNKRILEETGYPIHRGIPIASKFAAKIIKCIREELGDNIMEVSKLPKHDIYNGKIKFGIKKFINIEINKKLGIKKNDVKFVKE